MDASSYIAECLKQVLKMKGQDLFLKIGSSPRVRVGGQVLPIPMEPVQEKHAQEMIGQFLKPIQQEMLQKNHSVDFSFSLPGTQQRFRGNIFLQQGAYSIVIRVLWKKIPTFEELRLPEVFKKVSLERSGIILIGGPVSSGKSTTITAMLDLINEKSKRHILTIEDPVEYLHTDKNCTINQREIGIDAEDFRSALKHVVRQSPDVIMIGEMRDAETFHFAVAAAEVGRLVIGTVHGRTVQQMFDRILGFFPPAERDTILGQLYPNITCFAAQRLLVHKDGQSLVPAFEVLIGNYTTRQLVHEKKFDKLDQAMRNGLQEGMLTMEQALIKLWEEGLITQETAMASAERPQEIENYMKGIRMESRSGRILGG